MKPIHYKDPRVAGFFVPGVVFLILGFAKEWLFFLIGALFLFWGIKENNRIS
ncbi:hypothetical protein NST62_06850 [Ureibacillus sp. FSL K6-8385]|uniref:hypothetical protein n=1 Tax=Ureibacillus TaxID=160795 RepID=UPI0015EEAE57|nr:hypothetical protein [Ureibacillus terrenus]MED3662348.1 hypothetical protein [Ureibacillus terrenus]MED3764514.1 hypothetical protein [Ureibacillus terrenus]